MEINQVIRGTGSLGRIPFTGSRTSSDAAANATVAIYVAGTTTAITVGVADVVMVTDFSMMCVPGGACAISIGNAAAGTTLFGGTFGQNGGVAKSFRTPVVGVAGAVVKVTAPIGGYTVTVQGEVIRG